MMEDQSYCQHMGDGNCELEDDVADALDMQVLQDGREEILDKIADLQLALAASQTEVKQLRLIMDETAGMLETEESTPQHEAERLRGALAGFQTPMPDLSFFHTAEGED